MGDGAKEPGAQVPLSTDPYGYVEHANVQVVAAPDGTPRFAGGPPPEPPEGLTTDNFVCSSAPGRAPCRYYGALVLDAEGQIRGSHKPRQIKRYCTKLASQSELMELTDSNVYACTLRDPPDPGSQSVVDRLEERQRELADDAQKEAGEFDI